MSQAGNVLIQILMIQQPCCTRAGLVTLSLALVSVHSFSLSLSSFFLCLACPGHPMVPGFIASLASLLLQSCILVMALVGMVLALVMARWTVACSRCFDVCFLALHGKATATRDAGRLAPPRLGAPPPAATRQQQMRELATEVRRDASSSNSELDVRSSGRNCAAC